MGKPELEAQRLLSRFKIAQPAVPVDGLAIKLGIRIKYDSIRNNVSGMLYRQGEHATIGVNSHHANTRQRFTIAHEIGHYLLHPGKPLIVDEVVRVNYRDDRSSMATDTQEIAANQFAAELLMPRTWVIRHVEDRQRNRAESFDRLTAGLAETFDVSPQAMHYRLANLGIALP